MSRRNGQPEEFCAFVRVYSRAVSSVQTPNVNLKMNFKCDSCSNLSFRTQHGALEKKTKLVGGHQTGMIMHSLTWPQVAFGGSE